MIWLGVFAGSVNKHSDANIVHRCVTAMSLHVSHCDDSCLWCNDCHGSHKPIDNRDCGKLSGKKRNNHVKQEPVVICFERKKSLYCLPVEVFSKLKRENFPQRFLASVIIRS